MFDSTKLCVQTARPPWWWCSRQRKVFVVSLRPFCWLLVSSRRFRPRTMDPTIWSESTRSSSHTRVSANCLKIYCFYNDFFLNQYNVLGTGISLPFWDYIGSTIVSSNYVRLTPDQQSKRGGIWNQVVRQPLPAKVMRWLMPLFLSFFSECYRALY